MDIASTQHGAPGRPAKYGLACYRALLEIARDASISLEEYARKMIASEEMHVSEIEKKRNLSA